MNRRLERRSAAALLQTLVWVVVGIGALALPVLSFIVELQFQRGTLASVAGTRAFLIEQRIAANPTLWRFEEARLAEMLRQGALLGEAADRRSIIDAAGALIVESERAGTLAAPLIEHRAPLYDAGRVVGWMRIERSLRQQVWALVGGACLALAVGALLISFLTRLPLRALKRAEAELQHKAFHDQLTGLHNREAFRRLLDEAVGRARRAGSRVVVLFIDLDRFKSINDTLGHDAGDEVLRAAAARLRGAVRAAAAVARLSGDEFAIAIEGPDIDAGALADAVLAAFDTPFLAKERRWHLSCSVGAALFPNHAPEADRLLAFADTAMLHAKGNGRSSRCVYSDEMQDSVARRVVIEDDLRGALARREFRLHYQPLVALPEGRHKGAEALLRWQHPQRGLVPPNEFIPVLEDLGLIHAVGEWVLQQACRQARRWLDEGLALETIAVNVSALQFARGADFVAQVRQALTESGLPPRCLQLELTEGILMSDSERSLALLKELEGLGVSLAIDDFGTGYSSLAYLRSFPVATLKVDRSFVARMSADAKDASIVTAVVRLAHSLGLQVTAEGIETAEQLRALCALGCDAGQGYLLGRPAEAQALALPRSSAAA